MQRKPHAPTVFVVVTCAALLLGQAWIASAEASSRPACPVGVSPYSLSSEALAACGDHLLPRRSTTTLPGGGSQANYMESNGTETSVTVPPPSFDAATASPAELRLYGIPPEPAADSPEYPKWKQMIDGPMYWAPAPEALVEVPPVSRRETESTSPDSGEKTTEPPSSATTGSDSRWSGYMDWNGGGCSGICSPIYTHSTGYFIEPASSNTTPGCTDVASYTWAGIGGWHSNESTLAQDGTGQQAPNLGPDEAFYEVVHPNEGGGGTIATKFHASPGEYFIADTEYTGSDKYSFYMYNYETHRPFRTTATGALWGKTAEFIVERPREHNLYNFKSVTFQGFTNGKAFRQYPNERIDMQSGDFVKEQGFLPAATPTEIVNNYKFNDVFHICTKAPEKTVDEELEGAGKGGKLPHAVTEGSSEQTGTTVKLSGSVDPEGTYTTYHFEYGTEAENYSAATPENSAGEGSTSVPVSATVTGLQPGTTYHYRITANSAEGTAVGTDETFKTSGTPPPPPPIVTTEAATGVTADSATLEANINPNGADTHYYFEYGTNATLLDRTVPEPPGSDAGSGTSSVQEKVGLSGLTPSTTYYYRVVAANSTGTSYGEEQQFTTPPAWTIQTTITPPGEPTDARLQGVSCWSSVACDAVGVYNNLEGKGITLVEGWNGATWEVQPTASHTESIQNVLESASCRSASECTATGYYEVKGGEHHTLAERWDGSVWTVETTPTEGNSDDLVSVACAAADACMAVGSYNSGTPTRKYPVTELWNGKKWVVKASAKLPEEDKNVVFESVSCPTAKACTAVGYVVNHSQGVEALVESWNGKQWTVQPTPTPPHSLYPYLFGVSCSSTTACMAVGTYKNTEAGGEVKNTEFHGREALIERWNGTSWELQSSPSPIGKPKPEGEARWELTRISCSSETWCVATGYYIQSESGAPSALLGERWKGNEWELELPVNVAGAALSNLEGLSCTAEFECTAVGNSLKALPFGPQATLAERLELP